MTRREIAAEKWRGAAILAVLSLLCGPASAEVGEQDDRGRLLRLFDEAQSGTVTMTARFTEEKHLRLLAAPVVSRGVMNFSRPNKVRWEYEDPQRRVFIVTEKMYLAYDPALRRAEEVPYKAFVGKRLMRLLGLGQSVDELETYYDIRLEPDGDLDGTRLLVLTPRRQRVRDRLAEMRLWVDEGTGLPRRIGYLDADGDSTRITFDDVRTNIGIDAGRFQLDLPPDVLVSNRLNGFALGGGGF